MNKCGQPKKRGSTGIKLTLKQGTGKEDPRGRLWGIERKCSIVDNVAFNNVGLLLAGSDAGNTLARFNAVDNLDIGQGLAG